MLHQTVLWARNKKELANRQISASHVACYTWRLRAGAWCVKGFSNSRILDKFLENKPVKMG